MEKYSYLGTNPNSEFAVIATFREPIEVHNGEVDHEKMKRSLIGGRCDKANSIKEYMIQRSIRQTGRLYDLGYFPAVLDIGFSSHCEDAPLAMAVCVFEELALPPRKRMSKTRGKN